MLPTALVYIFGFIGLAAVGIIPMRSWQVVTKSLNPSTRGWNVFSILALLLTLVAIVIDILITSRIFHCLTETYCGPSVASGWIYLAILGVIYLVYEILLLICKKFIYKDRQLIK